MVKYVDVGFGLNINIIIPFKKSGKIRVYIGTECTHSENIITHIPVGRKFMSLCNSSDVIPFNGIKKKYEMVLKGEGRNTSL